MANFGRPPPQSGIADYEVRFDYTTRADNNPVYIGTAPQDSPTTDKVWLINKFTYPNDISARVDRIEAKVGAWTDRATLF